MLIYNVTIQPSWDIHDAWKKWMVEVHLPEMMETACFTKFHFCRLLDIDESDGPTYTVQYFAENRKQYNEYIRHFSPVLRQKGLDLWGNKMIAFRSLMDVVH
ncbi:MAG: DUF4286 family protein [Bacteroidetes bacterium]|nr:DUF4286 family protein [Bacteroidota bacterium]